MLLPAGLFESAEIDIIICLTQGVSFDAPCTTLQVHNRSVTANPHRSRDR
jgi:hypothetical protein